MIQSATGPAPLAGTRVLDLGRYQAAPRCAAVLASLGADVIKVEPPAGDESRRMGPFAGENSLYWAQHNAGKRSLAVDLRTPEGKGILEALVAVSDVLVENFRPRVIEEMGFGYSRLRQLNQRIIVVHVSGFGRTGPSSRRLAFDQVGQAMSGYMSLNGDPAGTPTISPFPLVDRIAALHCAIATLAALFERASSGEGQEIDVTLAGAAYSTTELPLAAYLSTGQLPARAGNATSLGNMYAARDGFVYVADYGGDHIFPRLARAIDRQEWIDDTRLADRAGRDAHSGLIEAGLVDWFEQRTADEACVLLNDAGVPCARVNDIAAATQEPYFTDRQPMVEVGDGSGGRVRVPGPYLTFGRSSVSAPGAVPRIGEHTARILEEVLGMDQREVRRLRGRGIVA